MPARLFGWRCGACWTVLAVLALVVASFATLDLQWARFFSADAMGRMGRFLAELLHPNFDWSFVKRVLAASLETLAMSGVGTLLAALFGLLLAVPASRPYADARAPWRHPTRLLLNALRSIPELVWAALLLISAGLGPLAGTLALAMHTTGVLGRRCCRNCSVTRCTAGRTTSVPQPSSAWSALAASGRCCRSTWACFRCARPARY
jgi:phosphonate transport system permease protein